QFPDINGDGKADVCARGSGGISCWVSNGGGFPTAVVGPAWNDGNGWDSPVRYSTIQFPDINGDGKADVCAKDGTHITCHLSDASNWNLPQDYSTIRYPAITGDGKADVCGRSNGGIVCYRATEDGIENLQAVANGLGGQATLTYAPSSQYANTNLPFVVWTVA